MFLLWLSHSVLSNLVSLLFPSTLYIQTLTTPQQELPVLEEEEVEEDESHDNEAPLTENREPTDQCEVPTDDQSHDQTEGKLTNQNNGTLSEFLSNDVACASSRHKAGVLPPHGLPCLRELLRFLISIVNATDK